MQISSLFTLKTKKRIYDLVSMQQDSGVELIYRLQYSLNDYKRLALATSSRIPVSSFSKSLLRKLLQSPWDYRLYKIYEPKIYVFKMHTGEKRYFPVTADGHLVEPGWQSLWDKSFFFLDVAKFRSLRSISLPEISPHHEPDEIVWFPERNNFTHFFYDLFGQLALTSSLSNALGCGLDSPSIILQDTSSWCYELLDLLPIQRLYLPSDPPDSISLIKPRVLYFPIISQPTITRIFLRTFLRQCFLSTVNNFGSGAEIVFLTRHDSRRSRIQNIDEIEDLVFSLGGNVIDPSSLTSSQKLMALSSAKVVIAESSGCINFSLFAASSSNIVCLVDPISYGSKELALAGWNYNLSFLNMSSKYVIGRNRVTINPSCPIGSCCYPIDEVRNAISDLLSVEQ